MKNVLLSLVMLTISIVSFAQSDEPEKTSPLTDTEIVRKVSNFDIEGKHYEDVTVTIKSNKPDYFWTDKYKVKVTIKNASGNKVWNKTFKNAFLYIFSSGQIQVGKPNFNQMIISKSDGSEDWRGIVREKEGVY